MLLRIDHETTLRYSEPVAEAIMELRMAPQSNEDQTVLGYRPRITPQVPLTSSQDGFGNRIESFNLIAPHREVFIRHLELCSASPPRWSQSGRRSYRGTMGRRPGSI